MVGLSAALPQNATSVVIARYLNNKFFMMMFAAAILHGVLLTAVALFGDDDAVQPPAKIIHLTLGGGDEAATQQPESSMMALPELEALPPVKRDESIPPAPIDTTPKIIPVLRPEPKKPVAKPKAPAPKPVVKKKVPAPKPKPVVREKAPEKAAEKKPTPPKPNPKKFEIVEPAQNNMAKIPTGVKTVSDATITPIDTPPPPAAFEPKKITLGAGFDAVLTNPQPGAGIPTGGFMPEVAKIAAVPPVEKEQTVPSMDDILGSAQDFAALPAQLPSGATGSAFDAVKGDGSTRAPAAGVKQENVSEMQARYERQLSEWLQKHKTYPMQARLDGKQGKAIVRLRMDRRGNVKFSAVDRSTGHTVLDDSVMEMVKKANPMPRPPSGYPGGMLLEFLVPIVFELQ